MTQRAETMYFRGLDHLQSRVPEVRNFEVPWDEALTQLEAIMNEQLTGDRYTGPRGSALFLLREMKDARPQMMLAVIINKKRTRTVVIPLPYTYQTPPGVEKLDTSIFEESHSTGKDFNLAEKIHVCLESQNLNALRDPDIVFITMTTSALSHDFPFAVGRPMVDYIHPQHKQWLDETKKLLNGSK